MQFEVNCAKSHHRIISQALDRNLKLIIQLFISVQWLNVVEKISTFSSFSEVLKERLETNETKFLRQLNGGHLRFLELKSLKVSTGTDKRANTTKNVKLTI